LRGTRNKGTRVRKKGMDTTSSNIDTQTGVGLTTVQTRQPNQTDVPENCTPREVANGNSGTGLRDKI